MFEHRNKALLLAEDSENALTVKSVVYIVWYRVRKENTITI